MFFGSPEQIQRHLEEQQRQHDLHHMHIEDLGNRFRALLYSGLSWEDVEVLHHVFGWIAGSDNPAATAAYYEGVSGGVLGFRQTVNGEGPQPVTPLEELDEHEHDDLIDAAGPPGSEPQERIVGVARDDEPIVWSALDGETVLPHDDLELGGEGG